MGLRRSAPSGSIADDRPLRPARPLDPAVDDQDRRDLPPPSEPVLKPTIDSPRIVMPEPPLSERQAARPGVRLIAAIDRDQGGAGRREARLPCESPSIAIDRVIAGRADVGTSIAWTPVPPGIANWMAIPRPMPVSASAARISARREPRRRIAVIAIIGHGRHREERPSSSRTFEHLEVRTPRWGPPGGSDRDVETLEVLLGMRRQFMGRRHPREIAGGAENRGRPRSSRDPVAQDRSPDSASGRADQSNSMHSRFKGPHLEKLGALARDFKGARTPAPDHA